MTELPPTTARKPTDPDEPDRTTPQASGGRQPPDSYDPHADDIQPGTLIAGKYKLLEAIGEGGMGSVWMAQQIEPVKRHVALKLIKSGMDSKTVIARFEAERQALSMMDHPNIARILDVGATSTGRPFFVMELVKGTPITDFCDQRKLTPRQRLELFVPVCNAIQHAHQKGIIHRDIKPSNVLVALHDDKPVPKVIDFGVAKAIGTPLTEKTLHTAFEQVVGTPAYMSPEQATFNQLDIDTRSDVYSLGVLLYELLTGSTPIEHQRFKTAGLLEMLRVVQEEEPPRPSTRLSSTETKASIAAQRGTEPASLTKELRADLDWVVMKALEKDRTRRYETANGLSRDVQRYLNDEVVEARPPSAGYRLRKLARKYRKPFQVASVVALLLVAAVAVSIGQAVRATIAERAAANSRDEEHTARSEAESARDLARKSEQAAQAEQHKTDEARRGLNRKVTELYTLQGLTAAERNQHTDALLWFAAAAQQAADEPRLAEPNRIRASAWARQTHIPVGAFFEPGTRFERLEFHPGGRYLLAVAAESKQPSRHIVWDLKRAARYPFRIDEKRPIASVAWSADGSRLAVGRSEGVEVTEFPSGQLLQEIPWTGTPRTLAFSANGKFLIVGGTGARVWSLDGRRFVTPHLLPDRAIGHLAFHPNGERVAIGYENEPQHEVAVFPVPSDSAEPLFPPLPHRPGVAPCFIAGGRCLLTSPGQEIVWIDSESGKTINRLHTNAHDFILSPDERYLVTLGNPLTLWDIDGSDRFETGAAGSSAPRRLGSGFVHPHFVRSAVISPDGLAMITACDDNVVRRWDRPTSSRYITPMQWPHGAPVPIVALSKDGSLFASGQDDGLVRIWKSPAGPPADPKIGLTGEGGRVAFGDGGRLLLPRGASHRGIRLLETRVFDSATGQPIGPSLKAGGMITDAAFSPDLKTVALASTKTNDSAARGGLRFEPAGEGGNIQFWDWRAGRRRWDPVPAPSEPVALDYAPDGTLAVLCAAGELLVIEPESDKLRWTTSYAPGEVDNNHFLNNGGVRFGPDGRMIFCWNRDASVTAWDAVRGGVPKSKLELRGRCHDIHFSGDGKLLATSEFDTPNAYAARIWNLETGREAVAALEHADGVFAARFSPDDNYVLTACRDHMARVWDWRSGRVVAAMSHPGEVFDACFSPDKRVVVTVGADKYLRVWDWRSSKLAIPPLHSPHQNFSVSVSPDGKKLASTGFSQTVNLHHLDEWLDHSSLNPLKPEDLIAYSELIAGYRIDRIGESTAVKLTSKDWMGRWESLRLGGRTWGGPTASPLHEEDEWHALFDGKNLSEWIASENSQWKIEDGVLVGHGPRGHLFTNRSDFRNFHLRAEVKISREGNSGLLFRAQPSELEFPFAYEAEILHPNATGSLVLLDRFGAKDVIRVRTKIPADEWFELEVIAKQFDFVVKVNGRVTARYTDFAELYPSGHICLQAPNDECVVHFKKIAIRESRSRKAK